MSLRLSICSTTSCQLVGSEAFASEPSGPVCASLAAIKFFLCLTCVGDEIVVGDMTAAGSVVASKLDAIPGIVNMPECSGDLHLPAGTRQAIRHGIVVSNPARLYEDFRT